MAKAAAAYPIGFLLPLLFGVVLNPINTTIIAVAIPSISTALSIPVAQVLWVVAALVITTAACEPVMGAVIDRVGPRAIFLGGLAVVVLGGQLPLIAPQFWAVLAARVLLGLGTAAAYPAAMTILKHRELALGVAPSRAILAGVSGAMYTAAAVGPVLGGALVQAFGWSSAFSASSVLAAVAFGMACFAVPKTGRSIAAAPLAPIDLPGVALFVVTVLAIAGSVLSTGWAQLASWIVAPLASILLVAHSARVAAPFLDLALLRDYGLVSRTHLRVFLTYFTPYATTYGFTQWMQGPYGFTPTQAGLAQFPAAVLAAFATVLAGRLRRTWLTLWVATGLYAAAAAILMTTTSASPLWWVLVAAAAFGIPQGLSAVANQRVVYQITPPQSVGTASGFMRSSLSLAAIVTSGAIGIFFGERPDDAGMHGIGIVAFTAAAVAVLITWLDRPLRTTHALN